MLYLLYHTRKDNCMANSLFNFSINPRCRQLLEQKKKESGDTFGKTINSLIETFCILPKDIRKDLMEFIKSQLLWIMDLKECAGLFEREKLTQTEQRYLSIAAYLNDGIPLDLDQLRQEYKMQKIQILDGVLICPKEYKVINPEEAINMKYACIVECRNAKQYQIPTYLIFCNLPNPSFYGTDMKEQMLSKIVAKDPGFEKVIAAQIQPIKDPEDCKAILNNEE